MNPDKNVINTLCLSPELTVVGRYAFEACKRMTQSGLRVAFDLVRSLP